MSETDVLVVGAGAAGTAAATELRRLGYEGHVTLLNGEAFSPYNRTTVNKWLLEGRSLESVAQPVPDDRNTSLLNGVRAHRLDAARSRVELHDGEPIRYRQLLIATGSRPRQLPATVSASATSAVTTLHSAADSIRVQLMLAAIADRRGEARVAVVGGGLLGAETADALSHRARAVHLVDAAPRPLDRLFGAEIGGWVHAAQRDAFAGVHEATVQSVDGVVGDLVVGLDDGQQLHVDLAVIAIGVRPDTAWLEGSGLDVTDGVLVDDQLRVRGTHNVYAAGDLARTAAGRVEHWGYALAQGAHAGRAIAHRLGLAEDPGPFTASASYATRLHGRPVNVIGSVDAGQREVLLTAADDPAVRVTVRVDDADRIRAAVGLGSPKLVNKLRPLVATAAPLTDGDSVVSPLPV